MAQTIFKRITLSLLLIGFLTACGNVRFSANTSSSDGTGTTAGGNDPNGGNGNTGGNDPNTGIGTSGTPPPVTTATPPPSGSTQTLSYTVPPPKNQVDFLLIIDNSKSISYAQDMVKVQMKNLSTALNALNIDWQMCMTTTTFGTVGGTCTDGNCKCIGTGANQVCFGNLSGGAQYWGISLPWSNYTPTGGVSQFVLNAKNSANNLDSIFQQTITDLSSGAPGTGDERGIKSAYNHFSWGKVSNAPTHTDGCYRPGASVSVIVMSDENERSVGGDCSQINTALGDSNALSCFPLEDQDQPKNLLAQAQNLFGSGVHFTVNGIITDTAACRDSLNATAHYDPAGCKDAAGNVYTSCYAPHYIGTKYIEAAGLTNGGIASLCGSTQDLSNSMQLFANQQANPTATVTLNCSPVPSSLSITLGGAAMSSSKYSLSGATVTFNPALNQGSNLVFTYTCQ